MNKLYICILSLILLSYYHTSSAQIQVQNSGMEKWSGFNLIRPDNWNTVEQAVGDRRNKWVSREVRADYLHSGSAAIKLTSDTVSLSDSTLWPGVIAYGKIGLINNHFFSGGLPIYGRPQSFSFYVRVYHPVRDTATMRLLLTRWNPTWRRQDTLAYERLNIFPDSSNMNGFALFIDSISYLMDGQADTARIIISSGRRGTGTARRGNTIWLDDLSFNYPPKDGDETAGDVYLYPNPAITKVNVQGTGPLQGYTVMLMDITGLKVKELLVDEGATAIDVTDLPLGTYCYAILDKDKALIRDGNIYISRP
jgi:hypothetical protein